MINSSFATNSSNENITIDYFTDQVQQSPQIQLQFQRRDQDQQILADRRTILQQAIRIHDQAEALKMQNGQKSDIRRLYRQSIDIIERININQQQYDICAKILFNSGLEYAQSQNQQDLKNAKRYLILSFVFEQQIKYNQSELIKILMKISELKQKLGEYYSSIGYMSSIFNYLNEIDQFNYLQHFQVNKRIGQLKNKRIQNKQEAIEYYLKALNIIQDQKCIDLQKYKQVLVPLANINFQIGDLRKSFFYCEWLIKIYQQIDGQNYFNNEAQQILLIIGKIYIQFEKYSKALKFYIKIIRLDYTTNLSLSLQYPIQPQYSSLFDPAIEQLFRILGVNIMNVYNETFPPISSQNFVIRIYRNRANRYLQRQSQINQAHRDNHLRPVAQKESVKSQSAKAQSMSSGQNSNSSNPAKIRTKIHFNQNEQIQQN